MFNNDITLNPQAFGGANADKTYSLVLPLGTDASLRRVSATSSTTPETLKIAHQSSSTKYGIETLRYDRHLIRLDEAFIDPIKGPGALNAWFVLNNPVGTSVITNQKILDITGRLIAFMRTSGYMDKILNSEP